MTEERKTPQAAADSDALVTQTYREAAAESAPGHLNQAILQMAASAARPRYARLRTWTRPLAWAATVMLSVALVLEITKLPGPGDVGLDESLGEFEAREPESGKTDGVAGEEFEETVPPETPAARATNTATDGSAQLAPMKSTTVETASGAVLEKRQRLDTRKIRVEAQDAAAPAASADEFKFSDRDILQRAEDMARVQSEDDQDAAPASAATAGMSSDAMAVGAAAVDFEAAGCDESAKATVETWLECIAELEEAGLAGAAVRQRKMLSEAFPDFDTP